MTTSDTKISIPRYRRSSGAALVVVLSCLVLVAIVVVAFLAASATERGTSQSYAEGGRARLLAQSAMDIVQGQIWAATTQTNRAWASQPGALRTFAPGSTNFVNVFKLYSSDVMVADGSFNAGTTNAPTEIAADWASRPNQYVDLNLPVTNAAGLNFPIFDPRAKDFANPTNGVAGFDFNSSRGASETNLPMPVKWLYQLKDGTLEAMNDAGKVPSATIANPIIGRIAFWTDDDTCKININTAAEAVWWDIPRVYNGGGAVGGKGTGSEAALGLFQPAQREYQRYPGHPATVSLSTIFPDLTRTEIYALTPRIQDDTAGGSAGGTVAPSGPMPLKTNPTTGKPFRLYASVDELTFSQSLSGNPPTREVNPPTSLITPADISKLSSFLTAYNRAPEMNLFGKPRISMWPINANVTSRTAIDKWFATCSTINSSFPFYFQRRNPGSQTDDYNGITRNQQLFAYLQNLTSSVPPGFTQSFSQKFGVDRDQILTQIFDYIRCINLVDTSDRSTSSSVRPFAMTTPVRAADLFGAIGSMGYWGFGQVVPIRIGANKGLGRFPTISEASLVFFPLSRNTASFPASATGPVRQGEDLDAASIPSANALPTNARMYRVMLVLEEFTAGQGYVQYNRDYEVRIQGLSGNLRVVSSGVTSDVVFPGPNSVVVRGGSGAMIGGSSHISHSMMLTSLNRNVTNVMPSDGGLNPSDGSTRPRWPFISAPFPLPSGQFSGSPPQQDEPATFVLNSTGPITVEILSPSGEIVQTLRFSFPSGITLPTPAQPVETAGNRSSVAVGQGFRERVQFATQDKSGSPASTIAPIPSTDTVVSVEPSGNYADLRILTLLNDNVSPAINIFAPHQKSANLTAADRQATSFRRGFSSDMYGTGTYGNLVANLETRIKADIASSINGVFNILGDPGDWDSGIGNSRDGPYMNKPDEGDFRKSGTPYFSIGGFENSAAQGFETFFAPNRQVPSPGIMGSLPSRARSGGGWETLLFNPNPSAGDRHRGFGSRLPNGTNASNGEDPPDYLFLDLFNMPIIEPYAISEPFSTAGKINLNYQIVPFTYINRDSGLRALFAANRIGAVHDGFAPVYKDIGDGKSIRHRINADETFKYFQERFSNNRLFKSAAEICAVDLYPIVTSENMPSGGADQPSFDAGRNNIKAWWSNRRLTGDNVREQPYTNLYQNVTTQSNSYTVHVWAQAIQKAPGSPPDEMTPRDQVTGEYRVAYSIERFIDPNNPDLPDFAQPGSPSANEFYQFRVNATKQFVP